MRGKTRSSTRTSPRLDVVRSSVKKEEMVENDNIDNIDHIDTSSSSDERCATVNVSAIIKKEEKSSILLLDKNNNDNDNDNNEDEDMNVSQLFYLDGCKYSSYEEMVNAKRKRNQKMLIDSGLLQASRDLQQQHQQSSSSSYQRQQQKQLALSLGLKSNKRKLNDEKREPRRKSNRIAGIASKDIHITHVLAGGKVIVGGDDHTIVDDNGVTTSITNKEEHYAGRINDGSPLTIEQAVQFIGQKWIKQDSVEKARNILQFATNDKKTINNNNNNRTNNKTNNNNKTMKEEHDISQTCAAVISKKMKEEDDIDLDQVQMVAKVVPERIYAVCFHPQADRLLACAGDKKGHVGIWRVPHHPDDQPSSSSSPAIKDQKQQDDDVVLWKPHNGAVTHLEWSAKHQLLSVSYDSTLRLWDAQQQHFQQIFATYDDDSQYKHRIGYNLDQGRSFWIQYACFASNDSNSILFSTSQGTVGQFDLRQPRRSSNSLSFYQQLSPKKINSLSMHPNGHLLATAGLDTTVQLWDIRKFQSSQNNKINNNNNNKTPKSLASYCVGRSINSTFFSPNGQQLLTTTMADTLDIFNTDDVSNSKFTKPDRSIRHDNRTGRWLSTLMARWHPTVDDLFVVGSMKRPRMMELYNSMSGTNISQVTGETMTAVASRCCFHPSSQHITLMGGNSSGRVVIAR